jgi:TolB-like protein
MRWFTVISAIFLLLFLPHENPAQTLYLVTSGELTQGKSASFAGGSACCNCQIDHYGNLPDDLPKGKVSTVSFYLRGSRQSSYYTRIKEGPNSLKLILGVNESIATSQKNSTGDQMSDKAPWILNFVFSPPAPVDPLMKWQLLDGDNEKYSAVLLHSSDVDLEHGIRGFYKTYGCQYARTEQQSYSVKFEYAESEKPIPRMALDQKLKPVGAVRDTVYKTAVVEFTERGDLGIQDAGSIVAEWITTALNQTGAFEVYERLSLDKIMEEHKLGMSGILDDKTIAEIGRMRGVQAIVTGSVIKFGNIISVTAKVIDVETAKIIDSADAKVDNVDAISAEVERIAWNLAID